MISCIVLQFSKNLSFVKAYILISPLNWFKFKRFVQILIRVIRGQILVFTQKPFLESK